MKKFKVKRHVHAHVCGNNVGVAHKISEKYGWLARLRIELVHEYIDYIVNVNTKNVIVHRMLIYGRPSWFG